MPAHIIENAAVVPCWTTFLGAMAGALCAADNADCDIEDLAGRTGFAFRLNIHSDVCPSGPTAIPPHDAVRRAFDQVGWDFDYYFSASSDNTFPLAQNRAVAAIEASILRGVPAIVWGVGVPEFCLVTGFDSDDRRFTVSTLMGADSDAKGVSYGELGLGPVPFLEVVIPLERVEVDPSRVAREALGFAVSHARGRDLRLPGYANGLAAYALWMESLTSRRAGAFGVAYNAQVYAQARSFAKEYLADLVSENLLGSRDPLARAAESYERVADNLASLAEMFPFDPGLPRDEKVAADKAAEAAALLERALFWEAGGIDKLETLLKTPADQ